MRQPARENLWRDPQWNEREGSCSDLNKSGDNGTCCEYVLKIDLKSIRYDDDDFKVLWMNCSLSNVDLWTSSEIHFKAPQ